MIVSYPRHIAGRIVLIVMTLGGSQLGQYCSHTDCARSASLFDPWFSDEVADLGSKDAAMQMSGVWCIELSELDAYSRAETGRIKAWTSRNVDRFRPPYGSRVIESPRSCVFVGTTNGDSYLKDETGNR